jgi:hypothetical protein
MKIKIAVAKETYTGFPCVRLFDEQEFVSLLPVTKIQAEEWIWRGGAVDASRLSNLLNRLEVCNTGDEFPETVQKLTRQPFEQLGPDTLLSLVATHLSVWNDGEEVRPDVRFPTPSSEWGRLIKWLGGRIPEQREWAITVDDLRLIPTKAIIKGVLSTSIEWDHVVRELLKKVEETIAPDAVGLPFMKEGLYELVADREQLDRYVPYEWFNKVPGKEWRPLVAGDSPVWPTLNQADGTKLAHYRPLRRHTLPVVAARLWYANSEVTGQLPNEEYESFVVEEIHVDEPQPEVSLPPKSAVSPLSRLVPSWLLPRRSPEHYGSSLLHLGDLKDPAGLAIKLRDAQDPLSQYLRGQFSPEMQGQLKEHDDLNSLPESLHFALVEGLNQLLRDPGLFAHATPTKETRKLFERKPDGEDLIRLNRRLLEKAYRREIAKVSEGRKLTQFTVPHETMKLKCMACYKPVEEEVYETTGFYCYNELEPINSPEGVPGIKGTRKHSVEFPSVESPRQIRDIEQVPRLYLDVARSQPNDIRVVALGGFREAGKTTWLLSLGGLMDYPDSNSTLFRAFPKSWNCLHIPCSAGDYTMGKATDRQLWTELMWLDGLLPLRNSAQEKAFRCPVRFIRSAETGEETILTILNDVAGDTLLETSINLENFPHVTSTTDTLFFLPAGGISTNFIQRFIRQMGSARDAGFVVDLKKINLILVFSKIDQLKHGDREERELYERILPRPYKFPAERDEAGLKAYLDEMGEVHWGIEEWIRRYRPMLERFSDFFGSVRYCGLSAFGFQPKKETGLELEHSLPFCPEPVRVVDPLLWLLKENHWARF